MHILTKVFVLIAAVLSIMMAALAIAYSVNADRILADYRDTQATADSAISALSAQSAAHGQERASLRDGINSLTDELASRDADTRRLEASNSELRIALRQAEAGRESISSKIAQLGVTTETQAKIIDEYKTEHSRLQEAELNSRDEKIDLEKSLSDLESQVIVLRQVKRAREEQIEELRLALSDEINGTSSSNASQSRAVTEIAGPVVRGSIDEVRLDPTTGDTLIKLNLGSNDRLKENSRLYVFRGDDLYIGDIVIFRVDLNHAVGRVALTANNQDVRVGDQVMSKFGS